MLKRDRIIEIEKENNQILYRISQKGINLAINISNLGYTKEVNFLTKKLTLLTQILLIIAIITLFSSFMQILISLYSKYY